jgi:hypothetical protein
MAPAQPSAAQAQALVQELLNGGRVKANNAARLLSTLSESQDEVWSARGVATSGSSPTLADVPPPDQLLCRRRRS